MPSIRDQYASRSVKEIQCVELYPRHGFFDSAEYGALDFIDVKFHGNYCWFNDKQLALIPLSTREIYTHVVMVSENQRLFVQIKWGKVRDLNGLLRYNDGELSYFKFTIN